MDWRLYFQAAQLGQPVTTITGVPNAHATVLQHQPTLVQTTQHVQGVHPTHVVVNTPAPTATKGRGKKAQQQAQHQAQQQVQQQQVHQIQVQQIPQNPHQQQGQQVMHPQQIIFQQHPQQPQQLQQQQQIPQIQIQQIQVPIHPDQQQMIQRVNTKVVPIANDDFEYGPNMQGELDQGCRKCNVMFGSSTELKLHFATAHNRQTFECFVCNKLFLQKFNFLAHIERFHDDVSKSYPCQHCDKVFTTKSALDSHMQENHKTPLLICPLCQRGFPQKSSLKRHVQKVHEGIGKSSNNETAYKCMTCGKCYKSQSGLTIHSKTKHQNTQYKCEICGKTFSRSSNVARHIDTIHNMAKFYPCKWCGKEFRSTGGRDMHIQAEHQGTRFDCGICFKQFKRKGSLGRHLVGVHGTSDIKHKCHLCTKEFKQKSHLKTHVRNIHHQDLEGNPMQPIVKIKKEKDSNRRAQAQLQQAQGQVLPQGTIRLISNQPAVIQGNMVLSNQSINTQPHSNFNQNLR